MVAWPWACVLSASRRMPQQHSSSLSLTHVLVGLSRSPGQAALFQGSGGKSMDPPLRGQLSTPTGSPHLTTVHRPLPPSRVIEELHRALATKHRQDR